MQKIRQALEYGTQNLDLSVAARLAKVRNIALDHQKASVTSLSLASIGVRMCDILLPRTRILMAIVGLTLGVVGTYFWNAFEQPDDKDNVDIALLSDDLPFEAYTDKGFQAWLDRISAQEVEGH